MIDPFYIVDRRFVAPDVPNPGSRTGWEIPDTYRPGDDGAPPVAGAQHAFKPVATTGGFTITSGYVNSIPVTGADSSTVYAVGSATKYWVAVTTDTDGIATSAAIGSGASVPGNSATLGHQILFEVDATGRVTSQHVTSSLAHQMCGEATHLFGGLG